MKRAVVLSVLALVLGVGQAGAQVSDETLLTFEVLTEGYEDLVKEAMDLSAEDWAEFAPVFARYREAMHPVFDRKLNLIKTYVGKAGKLSESEAAGILVELADIERDEWLTLRDYEREFLKIMPATRVLRFLQIENRLILMLSSSLAKDITLARPE